MFDEFIYKIFPLGAFGSVLVLLGIQHPIIRIVFLVLGILSLLAAIGWGILIYSPAKTKGTNCNDQP